ncbi:unnamed protein product, partial [Symbiodinium necroappetens]
VTAAFRYAPACRSAMVGMPPIAQQPTTATAARNTAAARVTHATNVLAMDMTARTAGPARIRMVMGSEA